MDSTLKTGFLDVGHGHEIFYEEWGNPDGQPVLFLHGGPGYGFHESDKRFFQDTGFRVIFFDQRGAGKSRYDDLFEANTTLYLLRDIDVLLDHLDVDSAILFGGSWGSTLALLYAMQTPQRVTSMILRGYFPANQACIEHLASPAIRPIDPLAYDRFIGNVPVDKQSSVIRYYATRMANGDATTRAHFADEWARFGASMVFPDKPADEIDAMVTSVDNYTHSALTAWYATYRCFLPEDHILKSAEILPKVPTFLVHGRNDALCPSEHAIALAEAVPHIQLDLVDAGHASSDPAIEEKLLSYLAQIDQ